MDCVNCVSCFAHSIGAQIQNAYEHQRPGDTPLSEKLRIQRVAARTPELQVDLVNSGGRLPALCL